MQNRIWIALGGILLLSEAKGEDIPNLAWPTTMEGARISQGFGTRALQPGRTFSEDVVHAGVDISGNKSFPVYAAQDGYVRWASDHYLSDKDVGSFGDAKKGVVIEHSKPSGEKYVTSYGHVDYTVKEGQFVRKGEQIGTMADWGDNTHLHFGARDVPFDPNNPNASIRGRVTREELSSFINPRQVFDQQAVRPIVGAMQRLFGSSNQRPVQTALGIASNFIPRPSPNRPDPISSAISPAESGTFRSSEQSMGPFSFLAPEGWNFERTRDGGLTMKSGGSDNFITFFPYPRTSGIGYDPDSVSRFMMGEWMAGNQRQLAPGVSTFACPVGSNNLPGLRRERIVMGKLSGHVAFDYQGTVYVVSYYGDNQTREAARKLVQSISVRK